MPSFKSLRLQAQTLLNVHKDDTTIRDIADLLVNLTRVCGDLQRQVKMLEIEIQGLRNKPT